MKSRFTWLLWPVLSIAVVLAGCASSTRAVRNEKLAEKGFKAYRDVYIIAPAEDPRDVMPKVVAEFRSMGMNVTVVDRKSPVLGAQATGFVVSSSGHVITCAHVLKNADAATLRVDGKRYEADVIGRDEEKDLAVLKIRDSGAGALAPLSFRNDARYGIGADIFTIGYPLSNMLGSNARYTRGALSSTTGLKDDPNQLQFSAQIQPGSSGGPLFDKDGAVLGVVQQTLSPLRTLEQTGGALPQDVNFAIKANVVLDYLKATQKDVYDALTFNQGNSVEELQKSVVKVRSGIITEEWEKTPKLVARVDYQSRWDMWYRFRYFIVRLWDFDTQEMLVVAGQNRDNMVSNEDGVIRDTFGEVRKMMAPK